jgi:ribosome biogenesis GTPase / thiamine phosphate phosphatase
VLFRSGCLITDIEERRNYIIRKSSNLSKQGHIIAANIDQALLLVTLALPETNLEFIDRFLVTAEAYNIPCILVFNKSDMIAALNIEDKLEEYKNIYESIGYQCLVVSAKKNFNIDAIKEVLIDKISLVAGNSGVGKSTLLNAIDPGLQLKIGDISKSHLKGMHTTTYSEMFELKKRTYIIDTPGIKGFGMIDMDKEELYHYFPEIFRISQDCQFYNCMHIHEPGCAVLKAVDSCEIHFSRYRSYVNLFNEDLKKYRHT